jgi:hypothetical protein
MQHLFTINSKGRVEIDPAALGVAVYRKLWNRDKSKSKEKAISELSYIYYMCDYKSFVSNITDNEDKHKEVCRMVFEKDDYNIDELIEECIELYKKDIPISVGLLEDAKIGINTLRQYFREVNLMEMDEKTGKPIHDAGKFSNNLKSLADNVDNLEKLENKVKRDTETSTLVRGGREKGMFEDIDD